MSQPVPQFAAGLGVANGSRRVVLVTSPGTEPSLADVVINLAGVCADVGQRVAIVGTEGLAVPEDDSEFPLSTALTRRNWPSRGVGHHAAEAGTDLLAGPVSPSDVEDLLGETGVPGVSRLDLRYFVGHPAQVVVRAPEVLIALKQLVDVVILEVPSYLSVHYGEGLTPFADVVLMVGERQTTSLKQVRGTSAALRRLGAPVVGMALTRAQGRTYAWGRDSEFDSEDSEFDSQDELDSQDEFDSQGEFGLTGEFGSTGGLLYEDRDPTEEVPITEPAPPVPAAPLESGLLTDHRSSEA